MQNYAISFGASFHEQGKYNGLWSLPGEYCWRTVQDARGKPSVFDTPHAAEAAAGHVLCAHMTKHFCQQAA